MGCSQSLLEDSITSFGRIFIFLAVPVCTPGSCALRGGLARTIHEHLLRRPILSPGGPFSFGLLDRLPVRLRRPYLREAPAGFGLERLAAVFMNIRASSQLT